jgi:hypothetical protein
MKSNPKSYDKPNDFDLLTLTVVSNRGGDPVSLISQFVELDIYENIFDNKLFGEVVIADSLNYSGTIPLVGNETIQVSYRTRGTTDIVTLTGKVFAVRGLGRSTNEKGQVYKLQFVSDIQYKNGMMRVACSKKGTIGKMVRDLFIENFTSDADIKKLHEIGDTGSKTFKFIFPYWSPLDCMNWLAYRAFSPGTTPSNPSCFVFYEDVDGFHFTDIMSKVENRPKMKFRYEPNNAANQTDVNRFLEKTQEYTVRSYFDRLKEYKMGMYSSVLYTHDITTKKFKSNEVNYDDIFGSSKHLNKYPLLPATEKSMKQTNIGNMALLPVQNKKFDDVAENETPEKFFQYRNSLLEQFNTIRLTKMVAGNSSLRLLDVIEFDIPKAGYLSENEQDWVDPYLSGRYLIFGIKHTISNDPEIGYRTIIDIAKDSLIKGIPDKFE